MKINKVYIGIIVFLVLLIIGVGMKSEWDKRSLMNEIQKGNKDLVSISKTVKEKNGQYSKLVDYFKDSKSLMDGLKDSNKDLLSQLKKSNEKLLQVSNIVATFEDKLDQGDLTQVDDSTFKMDLFYPNTEDWFINWNGKIFTRTESYKGQWKFSKLNLQAVLTETERGLWNARLIGPDFLKVDSIKIESLPPDEYVKTKTKKLEFLLGGGYLKSFDEARPDAIIISGGLQWKNKSIISIIGGSNNSVGIQYIYKFQRTKK